jgi:ankyrin
MADIEVAHQNNHQLNNHAETNGNNMADSQHSSQPASPSKQDTLSSPASPQTSDPVTQFLRAAQSGNIPKVEEMLSDASLGVHVNVANSGGLSALHLAARKNLPDLCEFLLLKGADPGFKSNKGNTALHIGALAGHLTIVKQLVEHGCDINAKAQGSFTPLYMAAQENNLDVLKYLLSKKADETITTEEGFTPLAVALQQQHAEIVAKLLEVEHSKKGYKLPAMHVAVRKNDEKSTLLLLKQNYDPNIMSSTNFTPLHVAARYGHFGIAEHLIAFGANVDQAAKNSIVPLHVAAKWGKVDISELLVTKGAKIDYKTKDGLTALHCASRNGHDLVVDKLLILNADYKIKTKSGLSALHMAAQGNHIDCSRLLLHAGIPVDDVTKDLLTPLHITAHCGHHEECKFLLDRSSNPDEKAMNGFAALHVAVKKRRIKVILLLLRGYGGDPNIATESGMTALHVAAYLGFDDCTKTLLDCEARPNVQTKEYWESPLHFAARGNFVPVARLALDHGADVNCKECVENKTALHIAARQGNQEMVTLLLERKADVEAEASDLSRPIHLASKEGHSEVVQQLAHTGGAKTDPMTKRQLSPLHLAAKYNKPQVARVLLENGAKSDIPGKVDLTPLHVSVHYNNCDVTNVLLLFKASPHSVASNGYTPLHIAAKRDNRNDAHKLITNGADVNAATTQNGTAPIHLAAKEKHVDMIRLLVDMKANPQIATSSLVTPLHLAAEADSVDGCVCLIEQYGVKKDPRTKAGFTPLLTAIHHSNMDVVKYLLRVGCSVHDTNEKGYSALHIAAHQGNTAMVDLLLQHGANPNVKNLAGATPMNIAQKKRYIAVENVLKPVTTINTPVTVDMEKDISQEHKPESIESFTLEDVEEDDDIDDMNMQYLSSNDQEFLNQDEIFPTKDYNTLKFSNNSMLYPSSRPTSGDMSRPTSGTSNISGLTISSFREPYGDSRNRLSVTDLARMKEGGGGDDGISLAQSNRAGFFVSFVVTARGVTQRGSRHSGVRIIIPPRRVDEPVRIKCRYIRPEKLAKKYLRAEGEAYAARPLEMDPPGMKFNGTVIVEIPHFADLCNGQREIAVLNCNEAGIWSEHSQEPLDKAIEDALNISMATEDQIAQDDLQTSRICRIVMREFTKNILLISRVKKDVSPIGPKGGLLSSSVHARVQLSFPENALKKTIEIGLQVYKVPTELINRMCGPRFRCSPVVTIEPQRRRFHQVFTVYLPHPSPETGKWPAGTKTVLRVLRSVQGKTDPSYFEDKSDCFVLNTADADGRISFTTMISGRYWVIEHPVPDTDSSSHEYKTVMDKNLKMAAELYKEAMVVPFQAKFFVFAKRHDEQQALVRAFLMLDDKHDPTLENQLNFSLISKSRDISVLDGRRSFVELTSAGNLSIATGSDKQQPDATFFPFRENRFMFFVQLKDPQESAEGTIEFYNQPKSFFRGRENRDHYRLCTLRIALPEYDQTTNTSSNVNFASTDIRRKNPALCDPNLSPNSSHERAMLRLAKVASLLGDDWHSLADELKIDPTAVGIFCEQQRSQEERGLAMLRHWAEREGGEASGFVLSRALQQIGREDINKESMGPSFKLPDQKELDDVEFYVNRFSSTLDRPKSPDQLLLEPPGQPAALNQNGLGSPSFGHADSLTTPVTPLPSQLSDENGVQPLTPSTPDQPSGPGFGDPKSSMAGDPSSQTEAVVDENGADVNNALS